jgi:Cdc6-like AAA superfamily ATPase
LNEKIDPRVRDTFTRTLKIISFGDYTEDELYGILLSRAYDGFVETAYRSTTLRYIAHLCFNNGWRARGVISIARDAGLTAEMEGKNCIEDWMVDKVVMIRPEQELTKIISSLDPPTLNILHYLDIRDSWVAEGEVLAWMQSKEKDLNLLTGTSKTTFYTSIGRLKGMEIIESELIGRGRAKGTFARVRIIPKYRKVVKDALQTVRKIGLSP